MSTKDHPHRRPNILFLMADQFRHDHLGLFGRHPVQTPHLDALARRSRVFTQCISNAPVCVPARIGLATGMMPHRLGSLNNHSYLPGTATTHYQLLRDDDYRVGLVGKVDLAKPDPYNGIDGQRPSVFRWGFTHPVECEGKMHAGKGRTPLGPYTAWLAEQGLLERFCDDYASRRNNYALACDDSVLPDEAFADCWIGRQAAQWLRHCPADFPFFHMVSFVGPHDPFDPPSSYAERFRNAAVNPALPGDVVGHHAINRVHTQDPDLIARTRRQYCASIAAIDDAVGEIMTALKQRDDADNTYVVFTSDHGEMLGDFGCYTKSVPYEGALRIPLMIAGPDIAAGTSDALVEIIDLHPTVLDLAGVRQDRPVDGRSLAPLLHGAGDHHRDDQVAMLHGWSCLRSREHKLVVNHGTGGRPELYDLIDDPDELHNRAEERPEVVRRLQSQLNRRLHLDGAWHR